MNGPSPATRRLGASSLLAAGVAVVLGLVTAVFGASTIDPTGSDGLAVWGAIGLAGVLAVVTGVSRSADVVASAIHDRDREG
jgi:hypothetical protein